jgi:hypothetical protein
MTSAEQRRAGELASVAEPERELVRRAAPFGAPAIAVAFVVGWLVGGANAAWSAGLGIAVVWANFTAHGLSVARAARVSITALAAVAVAGVFVRLAAIVAIMAILKNSVASFSVLAFALAVIPATLVLLVFEMRLLANGLGSQLQIPPSPAMVRGRGVR